MQFNPLLGIYICAMLRSKCIYQVFLIGICLLLVGIAHSQSTRKFKPSGKIDSLLNSQPRQSFNCRGDDCHYTEVVPVPQYCGTRSDNRPRGDTIHIAACSTQTPCDQAPFLKNDVALLRAKIQYPFPEKIADLQGTCLAFVRINTKGVVDSVWVERAPTVNINNTVLEALKSLPKFAPARYNGKPVEAVCFYKIGFWLR